ncbi:MAG: ribosomal RNA small subunit methyltransferase A [Phycisphaerales bacterium]|nr:ribosomal RNA small subunit methyltransferase A [Phycisphaerales bacterium]
MQTLTQIKAILESHGLSPRHALGQNFLIDANLLRKFVDAASLAPGQSVLEVGPGTGTLTEALLERGCRVVAAEMDAGLAALLRERLGGNERFTLVEGDCLASKREINPALLAALGKGEFVLMANLPYGAATPLIACLLADVPRCRGLYVTVQRELADRIVAPPGGRDYGPISVLAQATARCGLIARLSPECFWPRPEVHSAMVSMERLDTPRSPDPGGLARFCQKVFEKRRKQLGAVLGRDVPWPEGVRGEDRAEALSVEQLIALHAVAADRV